MKYILAYKLWLFFTKINSKIPYPYSNQFIQQAFEDLFNSIPLIIIQIRKGTLRNFGLYIDVQISRKEAEHNTNNT